MAIERQFDVSFISNLALREKQIQQNYRPIIAVHKWFARRPGTLFRGLLLSEFSGKALPEVFYQTNQLRGLRIADPFMGGGTPLLEANRVGCDIVGCDINPMSYWIVKQEVEHLDLDKYVEAAYSLRQSIEKEVGQFYRTTCVSCGAEDAHVKYFLWVKVAQCPKCGHHVDLFPGYLVAKNSRHPRNVFVCHACGELTETENRKTPGVCVHCHADLSANGSAKRSRYTCDGCRATNSYPDATFGPPRHRLFAMEYHCFSCKKKHVGRFFKSPDADDLSRVKKAEEKWANMRSRFVPDEEIPSGDETNRLHRWGYSYYREMFNARQLVGLELSARLISKISNERVRNALSTNLSDLLRYQNMLCRYDTMALKSLDIFSVHGFPVGLVQCESNMLGIMEPTRKVCIGSGGWANIIEKFRKAKLYCDKPFEVRYREGKKEIIPIEGEWIGDSGNAQSNEAKRQVEIRCEDATVMDLSPRSLDAVLTDPPYFGNVQYAELMDFCYVWLRRLVGATTPGFERRSTRHVQELTGNEDMGRGLDHFTEGLSSVFQRMARALKPGAPLVFTYHHNLLEAYYPIAVAVLDSGLTCSASLPSPGEMGASIHINGTGSSIIDTVFVCRFSGAVPGRWIVESAELVARLVEQDLCDLQAGGVNPTSGDIRCIVYGHLIRLAIWFLRKTWNKNEGVGRRVARVAEWLLDFGGWQGVERHLNQKPGPELDAPLLRVSESTTEYGAGHADISF